MKNFFLKGKIAGITPVSVYENKVYTQNITVELEDGTKIEVYDPLKRCKKDMEGKIKNIRIRASTVQPIIKNEKREMKIIPFNKASHADIYGYIEKILPNKPENLVILKFGLGEIVLFADDKQIESLSEKDYVVTSANLYLDEINDAK
ncbi:hypothetical protein ANME2D_02862 [Candidatus Methanoperedens nitroreducens]|uniref:Uncharacterized protein n=2 Tax=Candidatus Methanoperedens nitratireducens TaxID=1392998 RepID=A0A062V0C6_9EURY|nr:hypothetical protein ANME2D_02862 [Candidatus Methanoperedens nitroreducens]